MDRAATLIFLVLGLYIPLCHNLRHYRYINLKLNWTGAQHYCRDKYTDLATVKTTEQLDRLRKWRTPLDTPSAWIGLNDDPKSWYRVFAGDTNSWKWSGKTSKTGYQNWSPGEPDAAGGGYCVLMNGFGTWMDLPCSHWRFFVCYRESDGSFHVIPLPMSWHAAQGFCRQHFTDLATIQNPGENSKIQWMKPLLEAWIGMYRDAFAWSDGSNSLFRNWAHGQPDNWFGEYCGNENQFHTWHDSKCHTEQAFVCHKDDVVHTAVFRLNIQTRANLTDPATSDQIIQQLTALVESLGPANVTLQWKTEPRIPEQVQVIEQKLSCPQET